MGMLQIRLRLFPLLWFFIWPLRQYLWCSPISRGKGFIRRRLLRPLLPPPPTMFITTVLGGGKLMLQYQEAVGLSTLLDGGYESVEIQCLRAYAKPGTTVIDIGANVGIFTVSLAEAVRSSGRVMAFEPLPSNAERLKANVDLNRLGNVDIYILALGDSEGEIMLHLSNDPAFLSTTEVVRNRATGKVLTVPVACLDRIWREAGFPAVAAIKIDVEGGELTVLKGSEELLAACRPVLLVEANTPPRLMRLTDWLSRHGYIHTQPVGFMPWNYLFVYGRAIDSE